MPIGLPLGWGSAKIVKKIAIAATKQTEVPRKNGHYLFLARRLLLKPKYKDPTIVKAAQPNIKIIEFSRNRVLTVAT